MKAKTIIFILLIYSCSAAYSQSIDKVKNLSSVVWFGLDFSKTKLIGTSIDFADLTKIRNTYFADWNNLIISEYPKYDIGKAYNKTTVEKKIEIAINRSIIVDTTTILTTNSYLLNKEELPALIKNYSIETNIETGLVYIVESLDKPNLKVTAWVVFFNIKTGEILYAVKSEGKVGGFGFRNYWIKGIYNILKTTGSSFQPTLQ